MERIKTVELSKKFGNLTVFQNVNLTVQAGEVVGLIGANGTGKTTFIKLLSGLVSPDSGHVILNGLDREYNLQNKNDVIGVLFEGSRSLYWRLTGIQNYIYFSGLKGVFGYRAEEQAEKLLRQFDLWKVKDKKVETYSFGMKQRLAIACSMSHNPSILLFDEPSSGLDAESIEILQDYIYMLSQENKSIVLSSHDEKFISRICTRKLIVHTGCINNVD